MSPRRKTAPDDVIVQAAARVLARVGPAGFRLIDVADEVGLAPATLIQRFATKRNLLLAIAREGVAAVTRDFAARRARARSPLDALTEVRSSVCELAADPQALAHALAFHQLGLTDREFRTIARRHQQALEREIGEILRAAIAAGELRRVAPAPLARAIVALFRGSLLTWAFHRGTAPHAWIRQDLEVLLRPYRTPAARRAGAAPRPRAARPPRRTRPRPAGEAK
ncbi:MAG: helix-turn-helix domain-containing protein [Acidobacteriota bacterium]